ncbi:hypothetical protein FNV43_RR13028 [Rhamnella rubrinervis]|uniref:Uncharacterized protein n=1 Tax=Rhamnella rubrinervis TaxID=2594499 RepID=A0A8K0MEL7_9ROSA|nr:hypothetical protein FNV43_RR13028 [Rhamnella rubrinervis]
MFLKYKVSNDFFQDKNVKARAGKLEVVLCWYGEEFKGTNGGDVATCALTGIRFKPTLMSLLTWLAIANGVVYMIGCWPMKECHDTIPTTPWFTDVDPIVWTSRDREEGFDELPKSNREGVDLFLETLCIYGFVMDRCEGDGLKGLLEAYVASCGPRLRFRT